MVFLVQLRSCLASQCLSPDLSLPPKASTEAYHNEIHDCDKIAVYTLVSLEVNGIHVC